MIAVAAGAVGFHTRTAVNGTKTVMSAIKHNTFFSFKNSSLSSINICLSLYVLSAQDAGKCYFFSALF